MGAVANNLLTVGILIGFFIFLYSAIRKRTLTETFNDIKGALDVFTGGDEK